MVVVGMSDNTSSGGSMSGGIHAGNVEGNATFSALGHLVGGNLTINTIYQTSAEVITSRALIPASPYRSLKSFEDRDRDLFFGRDRLIRDMLVHLAGSNLLLVLGASGSGKSSVVKAGLLPALSRYLGPRYQNVLLVPDLDPFESLRSGLKAGGFDLSKTRTVTVEAGSQALTGFFQSHRRGEDEWLVFIDQFEEVFSRANEALREPFLALLLEFARESSGRTKLVLAMRADFMDRFGKFPELARTIEKNIVVVSDLHEDELRSAIEQPAALHGVAFEAGLVDQVIKDMRQQEGSLPLPLLQYALDLLWKEESRTDGIGQRLLEHFHK